MEASASIFLSLISYTYQCYGDFGLKCLSSSTIQPHDSVYVEDSDGSLRLSTECFWFLLCVKRRSITSIHQMLFFLSAIL